MVTINLSIFPWPVESLKDQFLDCCCSTSTLGCKIPPGQITHGSNVLTTAMEMTVWSTLSMFGAVFTWHQDSFNQIQTDIILIWWQNGKSKSCCPAWVQMYEDKKQVKKGVLIYSGLIFSGIIKTGTKTTFYHLKDIKTQRSEVQTDLEKLLQPSSPAEWWLERSSVWSSVHPERCLD